MHICRDSQIAPWQCGEKDSHTALLLLSFFCRKIGQLLPKNYCLDAFGCGSKCVAHNSKEIVPRNGTVLCQRGLKGKHDVWVCQCMLAWVLCENSTEAISALKIGCWGDLTQENNIAITPRQLCVFMCVFLLRVCVCLLKSKSWSLHREVAAEVIGEQQYY